MIDLEAMSDDAQAYFDEYVVSGSDDELFASGYLRGHVDLVIGSAIAQEQSLTVEDVVEAITASVNKAIKNGELEQEDIEVVNRVLNQLIVRFSV